MNTDGGSLSLAIAPLLMRPTYILREIRCKLRVGFYEILYEIMNGAPLRFVKQNAFWTWGTGRETDELHLKGEDCVRCDLTAQDEQVSLLEFITIVNGVQILFKNMSSDTNANKIRYTSDSNEVYWISMICKSRGAPDIIRRIFSLTISFANFQENDLKNGFYLIVVDKTGYSGEIMVDELRSTGFRQRLEDTRNSTRLLRRHLSSSQALKSTLNEVFVTKPPMLVLECKFYNRGPFTEYMLSPFQPNHSDRVNNPKIMFDRVYPLKHGNHSITTLLDFQSGQTGWKDYSLRPADYVYLSITRDHESRPSAPSLPDHLIGMICAYALRENDPFMPDWCKTLFSLGVLNSAWVFMFNIRWLLLGNGFIDVKPFRQFRSATAAIKRGLLPGITNYFRGFNIDMFSYGPKGQAPSHFVEFATIFIGSSDRFLHLHINAQILLTAADVLAAQQCVVTFKIFMEYEPFLLSLSEVLKAIQSWTKLTQLNFHLDLERVIRLKDEINWDLEPADSGTTSFQPLEELSFFEGYLPGNQFIQILPAAPQRLRRLFIRRVGGLSTRVISTFLALTHSTLSELEIHESGVHRTIANSTGISYDYPLDAWVDKMECLTLVRVPEAVASIPSLSRKTRVDPNSTSLISIHCDSPSPPSWMSSDVLVAAINRSSWNKVYIRLPFNSTPSNDVWGKPIEAAEKKGMMLEVYGNGVTLRSLRP